MNGVSIFNLKIEIRISFRLNPPFSYNTPSNYAPIMGKAFYTFVELFSYYLRGHIERSPYGQNTVLKFGKDGICLNRRNLINSPNLTNLTNCSNSNDFDEFNEF